jgi:hypothetical protein
MCHIAPSLLEPWQLFSSRPAHGDRLIVSLTSTPERIGGILPAIHSLLKQSLIANQVQLFLPWSCKGKEYKIPKSLQALDHQDGTGDFRIVRVDKDYGPATKLIPALQQETNPSTFIVFLDDDMVYERNLLRKLYDAIKKRPDAAHATSGLHISMGPPRKLHYIHQTVGPEKIDIVEGYNGVIVRRGFFPADMSAGFSEQSPGENSPKDAFRWADDAVISGYLAKRGIPRFKMGNLGRFNIPSIPSLLAARKMTALSTSVNADKQNYWDVIERYRDYW